MIVIIIGRKLVWFPTLFSGLARSQFTENYKKPNHSLGWSIYKILNWYWKGKNGIKDKLPTKEKVGKEKKTLRRWKTLVCQKLAQKVKSYSCWSIKIFNESYGAGIYQLDHNAGNKKDLLCMKQIQVIKWRKSWRSGTRKSKTQKHNETKKEKKKKK